MGELLERHAAALALFARQRCDAPDDAVQQAFIALAGLAHEPEAPVAWLFQAVRRAAFTLSRARARRARHEREAATQQAWFDPSPDDALDGAAAVVALRQLPETAREVVIARIWGGLSFHEIAQLLELPPSTTHRTYHEALAALRQHLGEPCRPTNAPCPKN